MAGEILRIGVRIGKFHGVIAAMTPRGRRVTMFRVRGRAEGSTWLCPRIASPAMKRASAQDLATSPRASASGLPCSSVIDAASSSVRASSAAMKRPKSAPRSTDGSWRQARWACCAASIIWPICSLDAAV